MLYTDGVTEVRAGREEIFGHRDLAELLGRCVGLPADTVAQRVQDAVLEAAEGRPRDDIAVLVVGPQPDADDPRHTPRRSPTPGGNRMAEPESGAPGEGAPAPETSAALLRELVAHLRQNRTDLREEWARRITEAQLLTALTPEEIFSEATSVYDNYVEVLETGSVEALQDYARNLSERIIPRGVETDEVLGIVLLLRDVLARSLFEKYQDDFNRVLDVYEPAANRIANTVAINFVQERERVIRQQQEAIRELSTPVLQVRERLLILPIIGVLDSQRARQLTEQLLRGIRANRAKVVVIDITGVPTIDSTVANHLVQTVEASRLMGASVIITGLSSEIAQTLVTIGVDLSKVNAVGDLQGGIEEAERLLGYEVAHGRRDARRSRSASGGADGGPDPQAGPVPDRVDPGGPHRHRRDPAAGRRDAAGRALPLARDHRRRHRARRDGLVRVALAARHRPHDAAARRRDGDRRHPARGRLRDGAARHELRGRAHRARPRGGPGVPPAAAAATGSPTAVADEIRVAIRTDADVVTARQEARTLGASLGFSSTDLTLLATAISEIARNITTYAGEGEVALRVVSEAGRRGVEVVASDDGPGDRGRRAGDAGRLHDRQRARARPARHAPAGRRLRAAHRSRAAARPSGS